MALPVKINHAATTGERQENDMNATFKAEIDYTLATQADIVAYNAANAITVESLVGAAQEAESVKYGVERAIAAMINDTLGAKKGERNWFDVEYRETGDLASAWQPHKKALTDVYKAKGHSNPSTPIKRIKGYGFELVHGKAPEAPTSKTRDIFDRLAEDLVRLYKAGINPENEETIKHHKQSAKIRTALAMITKALKELDRLPEAD